jgi:hypothetical protein
MTIYIYTQGNTTIETININEIPEGISYETIEREEDAIDMVSLINEALQIDLYYTDLISDILKKHVEKKILRGIDIPQTVEDEVNRLRAECNQKILDLGITNFSYRQSNLRL